MKIAVIVLWVWFAAPKIPCYESACWAVSGHFRTVTECVRAATVARRFKTWVCLPHGLHPAQYELQEV